MMTVSQIVVHTVKDFEAFKQALDEQSPIKILHMYFMVRNIDVETWASRLCTITKIKAVVTIEKVVMP
jgi:hypothetical protein